MNITKICLQRASTMEQRNQVNSMFFTSTVILITEGQIKLVGGVSMGFFVGFFCFFFFLLFNYIQKAAVF